MPLYDAGNIFAKIIQGEFPCHKTVETDEVIGFMDIRPQSKGHSLVIPKAGSRNMLDASTEAVTATIAAAQLVAKASLLALNADGITILQSNEEAAGQEVYHLHFHVIPRYSNVALLRSDMGDVDHDELKAQADMIRRAIAEVP